VPRGAQEHFFNGNKEDAVKRIHGTRAAVALCAVLAAGATWAAADSASAKEAEAMVKKGVAFIKATGKEKGYAAITNRQSAQFNDRDLYLAVHQLDGTCVAHGTNEKMVSKKLEPKTAYCERLDDTVVCGGI
jgi:cytochrome c